MADIEIINGLLRHNNRVFFTSGQVNVFPCSRRWRKIEEVLNKPAEINVEVYDPEARLNTERTNRIGTAINGFTDSFIVNETFRTNETDTTLIFVLAGYRVEVKNFNPSVVAAALGIPEGGTIYAHLSLHDGIELPGQGYFTEILYHQSIGVDNDDDTQPLDVLYSDDTNTSESNYFFTGISFVSAEAKDTVLEVKGDATETRGLKGYQLPLFTKEASDNTWQLVEASKLPKIKHGETTDSIIVSGNATFDANIDVTNQATIASITVPSEDDIDTTVSKDGISTSYIYAKSLATDGLSVGSEISLVDDPQKPTKQTTIRNDEVATTGTVTAGTKLSVQNDAHNAEAAIDKAAIDVLEVDKTTTGTLQVGSTITVGNYINVGSPTTPTQTTGDIVAKNSIFAENHIVAKSTMKAPALYQTVSGSDKPVPFIDLVKQDNGQWQLQISRVNIVEN